MDDAELKRLIEGTAAETRQHVDKATAETREHVDKLTAETREHFDLTAEGLRRDIRQVGEGVLGNTERLDRVDARLEQLTDDTRTGFAELGAKVMISYS